MTPVGKFRSTCSGCGRPMVRDWHGWTMEAGGHL